MDYFKKAQDAAALPPPATTQPQAQQQSAGNQVVTHRSAPLPNFNAPPKPGVAPVNYVGNALPSRFVPHNGQLVSPEAAMQMQAQQAEAEAEAEKNKPKETKQKETVDQVYVKQHLNSLQGRLKQATSSGFLMNNGHWDPSATAPKPTEAPNLFDQKKNPTAHSIYATLRPQILKPLLNRYAYSGFQGNLEDKAWHPMVQRQLQAGVDRYQPSAWDSLRGSGMMGLLTPALDWAKNKFLS